MNEDTSSLQRILIVENSYRVGIAQVIAKIFRNVNFPNLRTLVIDSDEVAAALESFKPEVVVLDVDSLRYVDALNVAIDICAVKPEQVIIFGSDHPHPILVKEGMIAAVWSRAYWLNEPSKNPGVVLQEIRRAFRGGKSLNPEVLETALTELRHIGRLTPQQHRVMRLLSNGFSNLRIAQECGITVKAVERTISAASRLLEIAPSTDETNHRVIAAITYRQSMHFLLQTERV